MVGLFFLPALLVFFAHFHFVVPQDYLVCVVEVQLGKPIIKWLNILHGMVLPLSFVFVLDVAKFILVNNYGSILTLSSIQ